MWEEQGAGIKALQRGLERLREALWNLCFPRRCPVCGDIVMPKGELICPGCVKELSPVTQPVCLLCGKEVESARMEVCPDCLRHKKTFRRNFAVFNYTDTASRSMAAVKYKGRREYLDFYGEAAVRRYGGQIRRIAPDLIVPVPVHPSRLRERGFNQAQILAGILGRSLEIPVWADGLRRIKKTLPQKELGAGQRLKNLEKAFGPGSLPKERKRVLLVDDIYTTGSTLEACTRVLKEMGVEEVFCLTGKRAFSRV